MTAAMSGDEHPTFRELVAEEVRVALARRRMSGAELARQLGRSQTFIQKRLDGRQAFDMDDIEAVAHVLRMTPSELLGDAPFRPVAPQTTTPGRNAITHVTSFDERPSVIAFPLAERLAAVAADAERSAAGPAHAATRVVLPPPIRESEDDTAA